MKKILLFILPLFFTISVKASSISNIDMDIYVDKSGNATVSETWDANVDQGTEGYHPYENMKYSSLKVVSASMDNQNFSVVDNWNENSSLEDKAYKAGIYKMDDEIDVVFGISSYGNHTYNIKYTISNFVNGLNDSDMIYAGLFPKDFSLSPEDVSIRIYSDDPISDNIDVWGYGIYDAPCYVSNGSIYFTSDNKRLSSSEYMTILVKFPKGTFNTSNKIDKNFSYYYDMAKKGSKSSKHSNFDFFKIFNYLFWIIIAFLPIFISKKDKVKFKFDGGNAIPKDTPYFRDIPCNKDLFRAYWTAFNYNLIKKKEDFMGALILKWIYDGNIKVEKITKDGLFKDKEESILIFVKDLENANEIESRLFNYMKSASIDNKLESKEFSNWCNYNYTKMLDWFDDVLSYETNVLKNEGKIIHNQGKFASSDIVSSSMMDEAKQMYGLKKFLKDFTVIKQREPIEVNLWHYYLIYAQIFGIADEVAKQFKKLYPEIAEYMNDYGYDYSTVVWVNNFSSSSYDTASRMAAESYSSGGGGFSSSGGGSGSFGGSSGGGFR